MEENNEIFSVDVKHPAFKFNCAHFIVFPGYREKLHGHNYNCSVNVKGKHINRNDGYLIDFGVLKKHMKEVCAELNEKFIVPIKSNSLKITEMENNIQLDVADDNSMFSFPKTDVICVPIMHSSAEELARYIWVLLASRIGEEFLSQRGIFEMSVCVHENAHQGASYIRNIPYTPDNLSIEKKKELFTEHLFDLCNNYIPVSTCSM